MAMNTINIEQLREACQNYIGCLPPDEGALAEMLRCELWARKVTVRRFLCNGIISSVQPLGSLSIGDVNTALDEMDLAGGITTGARGKVAATPLRVVNIGKRRLRIFGTLPTRLIRDCFPDVLSVGMVREVRIDNDHQIRSFLDQYGGLLLTLERWAGFECTLSAGPEWLELLGDNLDTNGISPGSYDEKLVGEWYVYSPATQHKKKQGGQWNKSGSADSGRLWRGWSSYNRPMYFWTEGGNPSSVRSARLSRDESARTLFSLSLEANAPIELSIRPLGTHMILELDAYLPLAEYRYLVTISDHQEIRDTQRSFSIPIEFWPNVESKLRERLGVVFKHMES